MLAAAAVVAAGIGAGAAVAAASRGRGRAPRPPASDELVRTTASTDLSATGGVQTTVERLVLPTGTWVLQAVNTLVNFGPSDYTRCSLFEGARELSAHATMVGDPSAPGAMGPAAFVATDAELDFVRVHGSATVSVQCEHDTTNGATPYVDADAVLWATRSARLLATTTP